MIPQTGGRHNRRRAADDHDDPVGLVRGPGDGITHYVNDRPYAASSLLAVALKDVFRTALTGRCDARPELAAAAIPLEVRVPALRCAGGADLAARVFGPLGWDVPAHAVPRDPPAWGMSAYLDLRLAGTVRLADALNHLYVLLPVLDAKHCWVSSRRRGGFEACGPQASIDEACGPRPSRRGAPSAARSAR